MTTDKQAEFLAKLQKLQEEFVDSIAKRFEKLKAHKQQLIESWNEENLKQFYIDIHTLAGSGASFGFVELSKVAKQLEDKIKPFLTSEKLPSTNQIEQIQSSFSELEAELNNIVLHIHRPYLAKEDLSASVKEHQQPPSEDRHVIIVEDDVMLAKNIAEQMQAFGYRVTTLHNTSGIKNTILTDRPLALIVDIILPEGKTAGAEAVKQIYNEIKISPKQIPIIFMSCRTDFSARLAAVRAGASAYLIKPIDIGQLIETTDDLISSKAEEKYKILIIDDDQELAKHHALILENAGMIITICNDPTQVLDHIDIENYDLILMDLYMPECNGNEVTALIRQLENYTIVPIIYLSTEHSSELQVQALLQGGDDFLLKPVAPETLVNIISYRVSRFRRLLSFMSKDSLTNLYNHRYIKEHIKNECARTHRTNTILSVAMLDIDFFKKINDTYGHGIGDKVLKNLSHFLRDRIRKTDLIGRYGGEEFVIVFPDTSGKQAEMICEKLRKDFAKVLHFYSRGSFSVTFSCGIAEYPIYNELQLLDAADKALYKSKYNGRNKITLAEHNNSFDNI